MRQFLHDSTFWWAIGLVIGTPTVILILGEMISRMRKREHPLVSTLSSVRTFLLPCVAAYFTAVHVAQVDRDSVPMRVLLTLLYISLLNSVLALVNGVVFSNNEKQSWQARMPKLLRDLVRVALVAIGSGLALSTVWHINLGNVFAALGVGSIVLGLALQEPLGNLFSGLMLTFERPLEVGDWITIGDKGGEVVEINWRAVHILTSSKELHILPNSTLAKNSFANYSRPTRVYSDSIEIAFPSFEPPNRIKELVNSVVQDTPGVLQDPPAVVRTNRYDNASTSIIYRIGFHVEDYTKLSSVRDEMLTRLWYAATRAGLSVATPSSVASQSGKKQIEGLTDLPEQLLRSLRQFGLTDLEDFTDRLSHLTIRRYARGETVMKEGVPFDGLFLILEGDVSLTVRDPHGNSQPVVQLSRGEFFGERSLLSSQSSDVTVTALRDLEAIVLDTAQLHVLLEKTPRLAREIGQVMETRRQIIQRLRSSQHSRLAG